MALTFLKIDMQHIVPLRLLEALKDSGLIQLNVLKTG